MWTATAVRKCYIHTEFLINTNADSWSRVLETTSTNISPQQKMWTSAATYKTLNTHLIDTHISSD